MNGKVNKIGKGAVVAGLVLLVSGCNTMSRLSEVGDGPQVSEIQNPTLMASYRPVSMPMPAPMIAEHNPNSLWRSGARAFFKDQRAKRVGDILTVNLELSDSASFDNTTDRTRDDSESTGVSSLWGWEGTLADILGKDGDPASLIDFGSDHETSGDGSIDRSETLNLKLAAVISQVLPNGNMVIHGRQEVRVNYELRDLRVTGIIRPEDINPDNSVPHDKIAEMRVFYGGRGALSDLQQPRWGTQMWDILFPF
ncbi:MAG: flagellar basal body L-ring protein FlgH [Magnetospiraceae bacterium]